MAYLSISLLRSATLLSRQLYVIMQLLTSTHHVYNNNSFLFNAGMDIRTRHKVLKSGHIKLRSFIFHPPNLLRRLIITVLQASAEIMCCLV